MVFLIPVVVIKQISCETFCEKVIIKIRTYFALFFVITQTKNSQFFLCRRERTFTLRLKSVKWIFFSKERFEDREERIEKKASNG